ncbi:hypothetical protein [Capnocytophaga sputigena]|jgi:hypothetical protein|uniref:hypothetical protein n=1 Tax=Capnocytophaga sputigena TaxID=1019 RepID=UPI00288BD78A|nr:hypothetical protein [Capnocytophaga sputigena]
MKELAQNFRDNVENIFPRTDYNLKKIEEIKQLDKFIKENSTNIEVCYILKGEIEIIETVYENRIPKRQTTYIYNIEQKSIQDFQIFQK